MQSVSDYFLMTSSLATCFDDLKLRIESSISARWGFCNNIVYKMPYCLIIIALTIARFNPNGMAKKTV